jgi:hypothetical protein
LACQCTFLDRPGFLPPSSAVCFVQKGSATNIISKPHTRAHKPTHQTIPPPLIISIDKPSNSSGGCLLKDNFTPAVRWWFPFFSRFLLSCSLPPTFSSSSGRPHHEKTSDTNIVIIITSHKPGCLPVVTPISTRSLVRTRTLLEARLYVSSQPICHHSLHSVITRIEFLVKRAINSYCQPLPSVIVIRSTIERRRKGSRKASQGQRKGPGKRPGQNTGGDCVPAFFWRW